MKQIIAYRFEENDKLYYVSPQGKIQTITIHKNHLKEKYSDIPTKALIENYHLKPEEPVETFQNSQLYLWNPFKHQTNHDYYLDYYKVLASVFIKEEDAQAYAEKIQTKIKIAFRPSSTSTLFSKAQPSACSYDAFLTSS